MLGSYIHDNGVSTTLDHGIYWDQNTAGGNLVANCLIENNAASGMQTYGATSPAFEIDIEENTIVGNGLYGLNIDGGNHKIVNNVLSQNGNANSSKQLRVDATSLYAWIQTFCIARQLRSKGIPIFSALDAT